MIFNIEVTDSELFDMMKNGSSNQKIFVDYINKYKAYKEVFNTLEELQDSGVQIDIRGYINGGVLFLTDDISEVSDDNFYIAEVVDSLYLCLE